MSFVMIATGAASRSPVRTLSIRHVLVGGAVAAALLVAAGATLGYWIATPAAASRPAAQPDHARPAMPFALEQIGALSGRLFKLESQAAQLSQRLGVQPAASGLVAPRTPVTLQAPAMTQGAVTPPQGKLAGTGGPMLPPRPADAALDALDAVQAQLARVEQQIALVADAASLHSLALMRWPSRLPVAGAELASRYGNREDPLTHHQAFHAGLDFAAEQGTPIQAAAGGTVSFAGFRPDFGWVVEIDHGNGLTTRYAHASRLLVKTGAVVAPGDRIAAVGSTGRSTGPHLHFEVLRNGEHTDPRRYLAGL